MTVVLAAHGSPDPRHAAAIEEIRAAAAVRLGDVRLGWLGHHEPLLASVVADALAEDPETVVAPLLLAPAFHARVDVPAGAATARVAAVLAPDPRLLTVLDERLADILAVCEEGIVPDGLVLAAAGSTDAAADRLVREVAAAWGESNRLPVEVAYASAEPSLANAMHALRKRGATRVAVGVFLLAPGRLHDAILAAADSAGLTAVAAPLGAHPALVDVLCDRATSPTRTVALPG
jgi:sirohydrochlorin ferrochelatase